jgi:hypothetical protein
VRDLALRLAADLRVLAHFNDPRGLYAYAFVDVE